MYMCVYIYIYICIVCDVYHNATYFYTRTQTHVCADRIVRKKISPRL